MTHASYVSTEETASQNGTWVPEKNGHGKRPEGAGPQKGKGKKTAHLLKKATLVWLFFVGGERLLYAAAIGQDRVPAYAKKQRDSFAVLYEVF